VVVTVLGLFVCGQMTTLLGAVLESALAPLSFALVQFVRPKTKS